jgi:hypothetical protein
MGSELHGVRGHALRRSAELLPEAVDLASAEFLEPHRRGEVLVAAALTSFLRIWVRRLAELRGSRREGKDRQRVVEEGAAVAERLLTAAIRAIDYCPPVDLIFGDFLSALLTADLELSPDDSRYGLRRTLVDVFAEYGIRPACEESVLGPGYWEPAPATLSHAGIHFDSMQRDPDEVFRFVWENRRRLRLHDTYTQVQSVRPTIRFDIDGFLLRETVAEYVQVLRLRAGELRRLGLRKPDGMANDREVPLYGGGALVFDEYGRLRFHIVNPVRSLRQQDRLDRLWEAGYFHGVPFSDFASFHRARVLTRQRTHQQEWH